MQDMLFSRAYFMLVSLQSPMQTFSKHTHSAESPIWDLQGSPMQAPTSGHSSRAKSSHSTPVGGCRISYSSGNEPVPPAQKWSQKCHLRMNIWEQHGQTPPWYSTQLGISLEVFSTSPTREMGLLGRRKIFVSVVRLHSRCPKGIQCHTLSSLWLIKTLGFCLLSPPCNNNYGLAGGSPEVPSFLPCFNRHLNSNKISGVIPPALISGAIDGGWGAPAVLLQIILTPAWIRLHLYSNEEVIKDTVLQGNGSRNFRPIERCA